MRMRQGRLWLGLAIGLVFLYLAFRDTEFATIWDLLRSALILPLLASVGLRVASLWFRALRWRSILSPLTSMTLARAFRLVSLGEISNGILPVRGGDVVRLVVASKEQQVSKTAGAASILLEKLYDLGVILIFLVSTSLVLASPEVVDLHLGWIAAGLAILLLLLVVFVRNAALLRTYPALSAAATRFRDGLLILGNPGQAFRVLLESLALWVISGFGLYLVIVALHLPLPWYSGFFIIGVSAIGSLLPTAPAAIGTTELMFVIGFQPFGVDKNSALACALLARGLHMASLALAGLAAASQKNAELSLAPAPDAREP
jgi:uncharacterized protein (TIRG00374 family)